jgi:hypothetical protein
LEKMSAFGFRTNFGCRCCRWKASGSSAADVAGGSGDCVLVNHRPAMTANLPPVAIRFPLVSCIKYIKNNNEWVDWHWQPCFLPLFCEWELRMSDCFNLVQQYLFSFCYYV